MKEKFNMQKAREIGEKCQSRDDAIDHNYWNAHAASMLPGALDRIEELEGNHCADCCCARSWEALGITTYTGKSIPEEINAMKAENAKLRDALCEAEARSLLNFQRFEAAMKGEQLVWAQTHDWDACHEEERQDRIAHARKWLKAEGKL